MTINRRTIKNWWRSLKVKPVSPGLERVNIVFTIVFAVVSGFIAFMTFIQQQKIEGMNDLLLKQDVIIKQNLDVISRLDRTQRYIIDQVNATKAQTKSNEISSKPLLDVRGMLFLIFDTRTKEWKIQFSISNFGLRPASMIKVKGGLKKISTGFFSTGIEFEPTTHTERLLQNQEMVIKIAHDSIDKHLNDFESFFFISEIEFFDPLTKTHETTKVYKRLVKIYSNESEQIFSLNEASKQEGELLKKVYD
ncbi:MAG: hypothetical protein ACK5QK_03180 [Chryseotalea sp.]